ncbi:hypothetical protein D918_04939 [Trichuris suis]|nr:hypothetical protein D918_04939 [Trichuris suis]
MYVRSTSYGKVGYKSALLKTLYSFYHAYANWGNGCMAEVSLPDFHSKVQPVLDEIGLQQDNDSLPVAECFPPTLYY